MKKIQEIAIGNTAKFFKIPYSVVAETYNNYFKYTYDKLVKGMKTNWKFPLTYLGNIYWTEHGDCDVKKIIKLRQEYLKKKNNERKGIK